MSKHTTHFPLTHTAEDPDELAIKYRVYREPENVKEHPAEVVATYMMNMEGWKEIPGYPMELEEVTTFTFVLKPDTDHHARVAIAAYAESVRPFKPNLADDLMGVLSLGEWDRENGKEGP